MASGNPADIVDRYLLAWTSKDFGTARKLLHDDLSFHGPIDTFNKADDYLAAIAQLSGIVKSAETRKVFVDGQDVCIIYDMVTVTPAGTVPIVEWHQVRDGKIAAIRAYFDTRPFGPPPAH